MTTINGIERINGTPQGDVSVKSRELLRGRLIVALDGTLDESRELVASLGDKVVFYKLGWRSMLQGGGSFLREVIDKGRSIFLDLKIHDIDETIRLAWQHFPSHVALTTLYGSASTIHAARSGRGEKKNPSLLLLTWLSSMDEHDFHDMTGMTGSLQDYVVRRALSAYDAEAEGVIASGHHIKAIRRGLAKEKKHKPFLIVAPGVREKGESGDDHKRTLTPYDAMRQGADYIVMGRSIARCPPSKRQEKVSRIIDDMCRGRQDMLKETQPQDIIDKGARDGYVGEDRIAL